MFKIGISWHTRYCSEFYSYHVLANNLVDVASFAIKNLPK